MNLNYKKGSEALNKQKYKEAISFFEIAITENPKDYLA